MRKQVHEMGPARRGRFSVRQGMLALQAVTPADLISALPEVSLAEARKVIAAVHRGEPVVASSAVRRSAARAVNAAGEVPGLRVEAETASAIDPFVKYLLAGPDGARFEAVRIPLEHPGRFTVCVSSQVGCALACAFCATGRLGLARNLAAWEIVEQVRIVRARLARGSGSCEVARADQVQRCKAVPLASVIAGDRTSDAVLRHKRRPSGQIVAQDVYTGPWRAVIRARPSGPSVPGQV